MLIHHLFYNTWSRELYDDLIINGVGVVNQIGIFSKLCVAVFVFVSGYGLVKSTPKEVKLKDFYWHRFKKLYLNYWFIWLIFVPVAVFVFGRSLIEAYGDNSILKTILDLLGVLKIFGISSYNPTWWFYSCIIVLYLLFPFLNKFLLKYPFVMFSISIAFSLINAIPGISFIPGIIIIMGYMFPFLMGMLMAKLPVQYFKGIRTRDITLALLVLSAWRFMNSSPKHLVDGLICATMALCLYKLPMKNWLGSVFEVLGQHSMNMFLMHTFIYYFWFRDFIYCSRNSIIIFGLLLTTSFITSVVLEWIKRKIGFYKL